MSKKFYDKLLRRDCYTEKPFHSKFGANILKKFGWTEGNGLGKEGLGTVDCIQIRKRAENLGIGAESNTAGGVKEWNNWWDDMYNNVAKEITQHKDNTDTSDSDKEVCKTNVSTDVCILDICEGRTCRKGDKQIGKLSRIRQQDESITKKRRKKADAVEKQSAIGNGSSKLSCGRRTTIIADTVELVCEADEVRYSCSRTSDFDTSAAIASTIVSAAKTKKKGKSRKKDENI